MNKNKSLQQTALNIIKHMSLLLNSKLLKLSIMALRSMREERKMRIVMELSEWIIRNEVWWMICDLITIITKLFIIDSRWWCYL